MDRDRSLLIGDWLIFAESSEQECACPLELDAVRTAIRRGSPFGGEQWQQRIAERLRLESTLPPRGRPSKSQAQ